RRPSRIRTPSRFSISSGFLQPTPSTRDVPKQILFTTIVRAADAREFFRRGGRMKALIGIVALLVLPTGAQATEWRAFAGVQSADKGDQILAFLPNELWVHTGDSITWRFLTDEIHTVSFLTPGQIRPTYVVGCAGTGTTPDGSSFAGATCVNSGTRVIGQSY